MERWQQQRKALGSEAFLTLVLKDSATADTIFAKLWKIIDAFEARFSRFQPDSELTRFNREAGSKVTISQDFWGLLNACQQMSLKTEGLFNPFILPSLQQAGYVGSWPKPTSFLPELGYQNRQMYTIENLIIGDTWAKIPKDSALDFGGIGKGYLLDALGDELSQAGIANYWLSLGGDILCHGSDVEGRAWSVGIQAAAGTGANVGEIINTQHASLGIATSGVTKRQGINHNTHWHHIIDPRTGLPAQTDILTATVSTTNAVDADILAKCAVILGSHKAVAFLKQHHVTTAFIQTSDGKTIKHQLSESSHP